ncbi:hypothetical protein [Aquimarina sp. ERC-38]|nr:hypothetical protein [Aquimarina sp. ERC-38]
MESKNKHILSNEDKEDLGLLLLMLKANRKDIVTEEEIFKVLSR